MEPIAEMAAQLDADRREAAKSMTFEQKALAGVALFDLCTAVMRAGIRMQHPGISEGQVEDMLVDRLRKARRFEART